MKSIITLIAGVSILSACSNNHQSIGEKLDTQKAIGISEALKEFEKGNNEKRVVFGRIKEVCKAEGCWFSYDLLDKTIVVDFDEKFTVPKDIAKQNIYSLGQFYRDTTLSENPDEAPVIETKFRATGVSFK